MNDHSTRAHSNLGASSCSRWMACPASVSRSEGRENKESPYAAEGTLAHEVAEICLLGGDIHKEMLLVQPDNGQEMLTHVQVYVDYIGQIMRDHPDAECLVEERFHLDWIDPELFGTNDCCVIDPFNKLWVIDFKYGQGIDVPAYKNKQLMYYALGAANGVDVSEVELVIVQPRVENQIKSWSLTIDELKQFEEELKVGVEATRVAEPYAESGSHCRFCLAAPTCTTYRDEAYAVAQVEFSEVEEIRLPEASELSPEQLSKVLLGSKLLSSWITEIQKYAFEQAEKGNLVEGFKLVSKRSNRKWEDEDKVVDEMEDLFGDELFEPKKLKSPAKLEKIVGKENIEKLTIKPKSGNTLVPNSDKRPSVLPMIEQDFNN